MSSFAIPLSGLQAAQAQLNAVSNNLANMSTVGYKDQTVTFADLYASAYAVATNGAGDPVQTGSGVRVASTNANFTEGPLTTTGIDSNMAISGNGFFVTQAADGSQNYTRAGDFTTNKAGQLISPTGQLLLGYPATNGVVNTAGNLAPIEVGSMTTPALATSNFNVTANLNASTAVGDTSGAPSSFPIYDSLGNSHTLDITYTKTGQNTWSYSATIPTGDITTGATGTTQVASGTLNFDSSGNLTFAGTPPQTSMAINIPAFNDGAAPMTMNWNLTDSSGNATVTQTALASSTSASNQDGYPSGTLSSYSVEPDGSVQGTFSSGKTLSLGQVAIASFANVQGLNNIGGNSYSSTPSSGAAVVGTAETGGRGSLVGDQVESSNVDISTEFSKLIVAQQDYSANAKSITAFNQVSQTTIAMIQ